MHPAAIAARHTVLCYNIFITTLFLYDELLDLIEELVSVVSMSCKIDRAGKVKAEYTHDGLSVYCISAGSEINIEIVHGYDAYELLDVVDGIEHDLCLFHNEFLLNLIHFTNLMFFF